MSDELSAQVNHDGPTIELRRGGWTLSSLRLPQHSLVHLVDGLSQHLSLSISDRRKLQRIVYGESRNPETEPAPFRNGTDWVDCPICGSTDSRRETEAGHSTITCVNTACASNGGDNANRLLGYE